MRMERDFDRLTSFSVPRDVLRRHQEDILRAFLSVDFNAKAKTRKWDKAENDT